tara:strand:+ start:12034 stop:13086 length:1053 start_codon:yes stop_codon:yes gene_type:complete
MQPNGSDDEYIYTLPSEASKLAVCPSIFNPWTDRYGVAITSPTVLENQRNISCRYDASTSYFHLSCSSRRADILRDGIVPNSFPLTDDEGDNTGKVFFMANFYSNSDFLALTNNKKRKWKEHYELIACIIKYNCATKEKLNGVASTMDLWLVFDRNLMIKPYERRVDMGILGTRNVLEGEYASSQTIPAVQCFLVPPSLWPRLLDPSESICSTFVDDVINESPLSKPDAELAESPTYSRPIDAYQLSPPAALELDNLLQGLSTDLTNSPSDSLELNDLISELNADECRRTSNSNDVNSPASKRFKRMARGLEQYTTHRRKPRRKSRRTRGRRTRRKLGKRRKYSIPRRPK